MTQARDTRESKDAAAQALADGLTKNQATLPAFVVGGKTYPVTQVIAVVLEEVTASKDVVARRAALEAALATETAARTRNKGFVSAVKQSLQVMFLGQVDALAEYGLKGRKPRVVSPKTQVAAAARANETRKLRGTKGSRQKLAIQAPAVTVQTTVGAGEPAPAAAPANEPAPKP